MQKRCDERSMDGKSRTSRRRVPGFSIHTSSGIPFALFCDFSSDTDMDWTIFGELSKQYQIVGLMRLGTKSFENNSVIIIEERRMHEHHIYT